MMLSVESNPNFVDLILTCIISEVSFGGGALITGIVSVAKHLKPSIDVFACEIETATPLAAAFKNNRFTEIEMKKSWVDGIGSTSVLDEMWPLVKRCVDNSIVLTLSETSNALRILIEKNHIISEGAGATTVAACLWHYGNLVQNGQAATRRSDTTGPSKVVAVLSGSGIDNEKIMKCLNGTL